MPLELHINHLSKTYDNGVTALQDINLTISTGMFGLLGPNGAGKSTLMRTLATLQEPDEGEIRLGNLDVIRQKDAVRETLGYLPQDFGLYPNVAAEKLLDHFAILEGIANRMERRAVVEALLKQTNLWDKRKQKLGGFSGGMRQRFGIALALLGNPQLLIVDEPTAGLDPEERVRLLNLLSELGENSIVILSTHIVDDVSELCTRMAVINKGEILLDAEPLAAVETMRGRVWERLVARDELPEIERDYDVLSTKLLAGRTVVRVYAETQPSTAFHPVDPELDDVYFSVIGGHYGRPAAIEAAR